MAVNRDLRTGISVHAHSGVILSGQKQVLGNWDFEIRHWNLTKMIWRDIMTISEFSDRFS